VPVVRQCPINAEVCPSNPDLLAYVCAGDIYVYHTRCGEPRRMTHSHMAADNKTNVNSGYPSFVMQEEFDRYQGYWWQPSTKDTGIYRILFEEVDESPVETYTFGYAMNADDVQDECKFPRAGLKNAKSQLKVIQFSLSEESGNACRIVDSKVMKLNRPLNEEFPFAEYFVRIGWAPGGDL
jgi:dipeptidyl-peptidase 9